MNVILLFCLYVGSVQLVLLYYLLLLHHDLCFNFLGFVVLLYLRLLVTLLFLFYRSDSCRELCECLARLPTALFALSGALFVPQIGVLSLLICGSLQ